jgi:hypothetical protein
MGRNWNDAARRARLREMQTGDLAEKVGLAFKQVWRDGQRPGAIHLRPAAVARHDGELEQPPPVARLISAKSYALRFYLTVIFDAQCAHWVGGRYRNRRQIWPDSKNEIGWIHLFGAPATADKDTDKTPTDNRIRQLKNALRRLHGEGLIELAKIDGRRNRFENFQLLNELGRSDYADQPLYTVPGNRNCARLPWQFYSNLWVYALTDSEIATYLALSYLRAIYPREYEERGIYMTPSVRSRTFGLTQDAYESHRALAAFGLIQRQEHAGRHPNGKVKNFQKQGIVEPYRFKLLDSGFRKPALEVISDQLDLVGWV